MYLLSYWLNINKAAERTTEAIFPKQKVEYAHILIPTEWREMQPLSKHTRPYQIVKWGTVATILIITILLWIVFTTDWFESAFLNVVYLFCILISAIRHPGNFYLLDKGIILNGRYYSMNQVKSFHVEKIIRWHDLYGYDQRVNNGYKVSIIVKRAFIQPSFIVVDDLVYLEKMIKLLKQQGVLGTTQLKSE